MQLFKTCKSCRKPDLTTEWREAAKSMLCCECNMDSDVYARVAYEKLLEVETAAPREERLMKFSPEQLRATYATKCSVCGRPTDFGNSWCDDCEYALNGGRDACECVLCGRQKDSATDTTCRTCAIEMATA